MKISPLDIKKQEFARSLRGYDIEEVHAFLDMLAGQWEESLAEQRRGDDRLRELQAKLEHYQRVEEALQEALQTARESSKQALENAKQEASLIVKRAVGEAEDLTRGAALQRDLLLQEIDNLSGRRDEIIARLRAFLMSEVEILTHFEERAWPDAARPQPEEAAVDPTVTTGPGLLKTLEPVVLYRKEETGRLPDLEAPEVDAPAEAAAGAPANPPEVPFDFGGLDEVLQEVSQKAEPPQRGSKAKETRRAAQEEGTEEAAVVEASVAEEETQAAEAVQAEEAPDAFEEPVAEAAAGGIEVELIGEDSPAGEIEVEMIGEIEVEVTGEVEVEMTGEAATGDIEADREEAETENFYVEEAPLDFKFFEPQPAEDAAPFYEDEEAREKVRFAPDADLTLKADRPPVDDTWIVRPVTAPSKTAAPSQAAGDALTASSEEIEKIRRILNDLD